MRDVYDVLASEVFVPEEEERGETFGFHFFHTGMVLDCLTDDFEVSDFTD